MDIVPTHQSTISATEFTPINKPIIATTDIKLDSEPDNNINMSVNEPSEPATTTPTMTPRKRGHPPKISTTKCDSDSDVSPSKKGKVRGPRRTLGPIPTCLAAASPEDKMILRMRDEEHRGWAELTKAWIDATGIKVGGTTLRMRYTTMKNNFVSVSEEDVPRLLKAKKDVEEKFEQEKWHRITDEIVSQGGEKYAAAVLQKKFKEMSKNPTSITTGDDNDGERDEHGE
ncbi:hypothetical protein EYZ11_007536 [Aspergillus tanneri]|uniref:Uncharacterized protein n=1 Tax=Aspergillus tanneri TaxID=1220188 RepID=A0A4S3JD64_9EURO|nr:uncharacterized protein ATNIH1004_005586 [Aspergillus tanneri]KAA8646911.1 hypothetical protein ATNIH1004_005586 [Aspergillus tanneri]THC92975.1 hypothetical protein EYZ11_007536 [Aspergillus tanneri]